MPLRCRPPSSPLTALALTLAALSAPAVSPGPVVAQSYTLLTANGADDRHPDITPDGQTIVFESNRSGKWHLYRMNINGSNVVQLTNDVLDDIHPAISPDGQTVVFLRGPIDAGSGSIAWSRLCTVPLAGGTVTDVTPDLTANQDEMPSWSADGTTIYFGRRVSSDYSIYSVPATGGPGTLIIDHGNGDNRPMVSPDGLHLTYYRRPTGGSALNIWEALLSDFSVRTQITFETANTAGADYASDGKTLLYSSRKNGGDQELWELNRTSGVHTQITSDGALGPDPQNLWARYDPLDDGRIIFSSKRSTGDFNIWLLDKDGDPLPTNHLNVENAVGLPGGSPIPVTLTLVNDVPVRGLEFRVADTPEAATVTAVDGADRGAAFDAEFADDGAAHVLAWTAANAPVAAGSGTVLELLVQIAPGTPLGSDIAIDLSDITLIDSGGNERAVLTDGGTIHIARRPGDLNGDNRTDAGDLVRLADIILGRGDTPTAEELELADCNNDDAHDIRDLICLSDTIVPSGSAAPPAGNGALATLRFDLAVPVRAIELDFPPGTALDDPAAALAPLDVSTWVRGNGTVALMAWDPAGRPIAAGSFDAVPASRAPLAARAWGDGGRALAVSRDGRSLTISAAPAEAPPVPVVSAAPTPFDDATTIRWRVSRPGVTSVQLFDVRGALRRSWTSPELAAGDHAWTWDGRDASGERVASGVYFARVGAPDGTHRLRLVRLAR
jgi:hypothetical protein